MKDSRMFVSILAVVLGLAYLGSTLSSYAGGSSVNGAAARAEAMQAFTAVADDPSAIYYNPAGITQLEGEQFDNSLLVIANRHNFLNTANRADSSSSLAVMRFSSFYTTDQFKPIYAGIGIYSPFARKTNFTTNLAVLNMRLYSEIVRVDFAPTIAVKLTPNVSLGGSLVVSRAKSKMDVLGFFESAIGYGVTGSVGLLINIPERHFRIGFDYRGPEKINMKGRGALAGTNIAGDFTSDLKFPGVFSVGVALQASEQLLLSFSFEDQMWSYLNRIQRVYSNPALNAMGTSILNAKDSFAYRIGGQYTIKKTDLLVGYTYLTHALPQQNIFPGITDFNRHLISIGLRQHICKNLSTTLGYEYSRSIPRTSTNPTFPGDHTMKIHTLLFSVAFGLS